MLKKSQQIKICREEDKKNSNQMHRRDDSKCCLLYKKQLDKLLGEDASTIVMDTNNDKEGRYKEYRRDRDAEEKLLDYFREPNSALKVSGQ